MIRGAVLACTTLSCCLMFAAGVAQAQDVGSAAEDLRDNHVTFEEGAVTQADLDELDATTARLQAPDAYFKVIVLAEPVTDFPSADAFAQDVLDELGGDGRVLVYDTSEVGLATNVDTEQEAQRAKTAAVRAANETNSFAAGAEAAAAELGNSDLGGAEPQSGGDGGFPWVIVVVALVVVALVAAFLFARSRARRHETQALDVGEQKVRAAVDAAANQVLALNNVIDLPGTPPEAKEWFQQGAEAFSNVHDELEGADTRQELETIYPKVLEAGWKLDTAAAIVQGTPKPAKPEAEPLFPAPPPAPAEPVDVGDAAPPTGYRSQGASPWLTAAAAAALSALASRGYQSRGSYRPPMDDVVFGDIFGGGATRGSGGWGGGGSGSRPRIRLGPSASGRGMGRRRR